MLGNGGKFSLLSQLINTTNAQQDHIFLKVLYSMRETFLSPSNLSLILFCTDIIPMPAPYHITIFQDHFGQMPGHMGQQSISIERSKVLEPSEILEDYEYSQALNPLHKKQRVHCSQSLSMHIRLSQHCPIDFEVEKLQFFHLS